MPRRLRIGFPRYVLVADTATISVNGQAVNLRRGKALVSAGGSSTIVGVAAALRVARVLVAAQGTVAITGQAATLTKGSAATSGAALNSPFQLDPTPGTGQFTPNFQDPQTKADGSAIGAITARTCYYSLTEGVAREMGGTSVSCTSGTPITGIAAGTYYIAETVTAGGLESNPSNEKPVVVS
jgi:hypothetical protein